MGSGKVFLTFNFYFSKYKQRYLINFMFIQRVGKESVINDLLEFDALLNSDTTTDAIEDEDNFDNIDDNDDEFDDDLNDNTDNAINNSDLERLSNVKLYFIIIVFFKKTLKFFEKKN